MAHPKPMTPELPSVAPDSPDRAPLPAERAFVVQLRADADLARGVVRGRIEHVVSGAAALFDSLEQLMGRMREVIERRADASGDDRDPAS